MPSLFSSLTNAFHCIPLHNFDYIYETVFAHDTNIISKFRGSMERFDKLNDRTFFDRDNFFKQSQWCILKRDAVTFFVENEFTNVYSDHFDAPDEHYFVNLCVKYHIPFLNFECTFANWKDRSDLDSHRPFPKTYVSLTNEMIENIKKRSPCLFLRKVDKACTLPTYFDTIC